MILLGCQYNDVKQQVDLGSKIASHQNESVLIRDARVKDSFRTSVISISDSRCPSDVYCVWAGQASVNFEIGANSFSLLLHESKYFTIGAQTLRITLDDVVPYPSTTNVQEDKQAVFTIQLM